MISVQSEDFDHSAQYKLLREKADSDGAIVTFTGLVRDFNDDGSVSGMQIEHYPGMTQKSLNDICLQAKKRWDLGQVRVIHRVGVVAASEQIVFVGVSSKHRKNAFEACQFIMDYLKTSAPFWKQEGTANGMKWVKAKESDKKAAARW
ncbi:MAG: molybdopterin synthase catalytic subunit [Kangiellaceae bacterium]|jgi:molybdopterin synthase catalytic subunit